MNEDDTLTHSTPEEGYDFFITDKWNKKYHFKIATFEVPSGLFSEAFEVIESHADHEPRVFHVLSDFDTDMEKAELLLKEKIKKGVNKRYLDYKDGIASIGQDLEVAGRILCDDTLKNSAFDHSFQIDNRKISIEQFIDMLKVVEGWNFKFQILDTTDDID